MARVLSFRETVDESTTVIDAAAVQQEIVRAIAPEIECWRDIRAQSVQEAAKYFVRGIIDNPIEGGEA